MLYIFIGPMRNQQLLLVSQISSLPRQLLLPRRKSKRVKRKCLYIPNLQGIPELITRFFESSRYSDVDVYASTECIAVIDRALPKELYLCNGFLGICGPVISCKCVKDYKEFMEHWDVGISHVSEILQTQGLWGTVK